ncbi:MAG: TetR/AcrR family transcriptional regulator [Rhizobiaceae bacterium]|nr:TetR/AcrR family transcriptional regulator [Rhizobiaceae bacterium]
MSRKNIETRNRILESTWRLLEADPGNKVRMSDIAKEAGISRQAVYLHFPKRADLLVATTRYLDEVSDIDARLAASRAAKTGLERLDAFIEAWGNYIPEIYGVAKALLAMQDQDEAAYNAWQGRMQAVREGCEAAVNALDRDGRLTADLSKKEAIDLLWTMLSVRNWEQMRGECGWTQARYIEVTKAFARRALVVDEA